MITIPPELEPLAAFIRSIMATLQWFLGGIFGLYVVFLIWRIFEYKKTMKLLLRIEKKIDKILKRK